MENLPLISIITPTYNRADYLEETIQSVMHQDYLNIEHIIINDGSLDETPRLLKKYSEKVIVIHQDNQGQSKAINNGLEIANGEWTVIVNSDDPLYPNAISTMFEYLLVNQSVIAGYPDWHMIDENGYIYETIRTPVYHYQDMLRLHYCVPGPCSFIRTDIIKSLGGYNPDFPYMPDFEFWLKAGLKGEFMRIPEILATFRVHTSSISVGSRGKEMAQERIRLVENIFASFDHPYLSDGKLKRKALSSAYYIAAFNTLKINSLRNKYVFQALKYNPLIIFRMVYEVMIFVKKKVLLNTKERSLKHWMSYKKTIEEKS